jgi:hypothetical protein
MIVPAGKRRHQVNQGPFKNDYLWNDEHMQKLAITGLDTAPGQKPANPQLQQTMNQSASPSLSGQPPAGAAQQSVQGRYPGEQIQDPARQKKQDPAQQSGLAQLGLASPGEDQQVNMPVETQARDIKTQLDQIVANLQGVEILLMEDSGGYKVGIKRLADDTGKAQFEMVDPIQWKKGTQPLKEKIDQIMANHGFIFVGDTEDRCALYKRREDVANESQIKVQKGGKK